MDKPYLSYTDQINHLVMDKNILCTTEEEKNIIKRIGYFNLINGYKEPFVANKKDGKHVYISNTSVKNIYDLKHFDDELRNHLLKYLTKVEEEVRTITAHRFDQVNDGGNILWDDVSAYDSRKPEQAKGLILSINSSIKRSKQRYINHYINKHHHIPTWIMTKTIDFSIFIDLIDVSKNDVKDFLCKLYNMHDKDGIYDYKILLGSLHWMRKVRNSCAHNERVYGIYRNNGRIINVYFEKLNKYYQADRTQRLVDLIIYMRYYLPDDEFNMFVDKIKNLLLDLQGKICQAAFEKVRSGTGIKSLDDLEVLKAAIKIIPYKLID